MIDRMPAVERRFLIVVHVFQLSLMIATWRLWFPTGADAFPVIPVCDFLASVPFAVDWALAAALVASLVITIWQLVIGGGHRRQLFCSLGLSVVLIFLSQHRLQPWNWLFVLLVAQAVLLDSESRPAAWRWTIAATYLFAGLSRLGQAEAGMSLQVTSTLLTSLNLDNLARDPRQLAVICHGLSFAESCVGIALLLRWSRFVAVVAAVVLHLSLLWALGPWGLNHNAGVLIWNVMFVIAVPVLFLSTEEVLNPVGRGLKISACLVFGLPCLSLIGWFDNWLGWQVYSPRPDVVRCFVTPQLADRLDDSVQHHLGPPLPLQSLRPLRIDRWSIAETGTPMYPEDRFQLAVIASLFHGVPQTAGGSFEISVDRPSTPDWWNRKTTSIRTPEELESQRKQYLLTTRRRLR